jgi:arsenate reductase
VSFEQVNYYNTPFTKTLLSDLLKKMKMKPSELLRKKDKAYKELDLKNINYTEARLLNMMINNPDLIERPIVAKGSKVMLARPAELVNDII